MLPQLGSNGKGTATRRPTAGPDGLPLTSVTEPRRETRHAYSPPPPRHSPVQRTFGSSANHPCTSYRYLESTAMTMSTVTKDHTNDHDVGERTELGRYRTAAGVERVLYGQRVATVVRFLPGHLVVLVGSLDPTEDSTCRSRTTIRAAGRAKALRRKRPDLPGDPRCLVARQREGRS